MRHSRRTNEVKASDAYDAKGYMPNQSSASRGRKGQHLIGRLLHLSRLFASARLGLVCFGFGFDLFALHCMSNNLLNNIAKTKDTVQVQ